MLSTPVIRFSIHGHFMIIFLFLNEMMNALIIMRTKLEQTKGGMQLMGDLIYKSEPIRQKKWDDEDFAATFITTNDRWNPTKKLCSLFDEFTHKQGFVAGQPKKIDPPGQMAEIKPGCWLADLT